jgi:hypothetical protein
MGFWKTSSDEHSSSAYPTLRHHSLPWGEVDKIPKPWSAQKKGVLKYLIEETFTRFYEEYLRNQHKNRLLPELEEDIIIRNPILSSTQFQQLVSLDIRPLPKKSQYKIYESNCRVLNEHVATQVYDPEDTNVKNWLNSLDYPDPHHSTVKLLIYHFNHSLNSHRSIDEKFNGISPNQACELYGRLYPDVTSRTQAWTKIVHDNYKNLPKLPILY